MPEERVAAIRAACDAGGRRRSSARERAAPPRTTRRATIDGGRHRRRLRTLRRSRRMACGRAVFVYDRAGGDGWVTAENYEALEAGGFSGRSDLAPPGPADFDLSRYSPDMGLVNRDLAVRHHRANVHAEELVALLREAEPPPETPARAAHGDVAARAAAVAQRACTRSRCTPSSWRCAAHTRRPGLIDEEQPPSPHHSGSGSWPRARGRCRRPSRRCSSGRRSRRRRGVDRPDRVRGGDARRALHPGRDEPLERLLRRAPRRRHRGPARARCASPRAGSSPRARCSSRPT